MGSILRHHIRPEKAAPILGDQRQTFQLETLDKPRDNLGMQLTAVVDRRLVRVAKSKKVHGEATSPRRASDRAKDVAVYVGACWIAVQEQHGVTAAFLDVVNLVSPNAQKP